jgi:Uma2 family endonuclease
MEGRRPDRWLSGASRGAGCRFRIQHWTLTRTRERDSVVAGEDDMALMRKPRRFTLDEYRRMGDAGILREGERVELIEGEIVEMTPIGWDHASGVARLTALFSSRFGGRAIVWVQNPITLPRQVSEFQPDLALLRPRADFYRRKPVEPEDVFLVAEVMDTSVGHDRRVKLPIYARGGVPEVWLVDVTRYTVEAHAGPSESGYRERRLVDRDGSLAPRAFPDVVLAVQDLVG